MRKAAWAIVPLSLVLGAATSNGTYAAASGFVMEVSGASATAIVLKISGSYRDNTCEIQTKTVKLTRGTATYQPADDPDCKVQVRFRGTQAVVNQSGVCGCGLNVNLSGTYKKK